MHFGVESALIFNGYIYSDNLRPRERPHAHHFWAPLIALAQGFRVGEIATLETSDIQEVDDIWTFNINDVATSEELKSTGDAKRKKTASTKRQVPISKHLLNAGFIEYVQSLPKNSRLFPAIPILKGRAAGDKLSSWFNDFYLDYIGLDKRNPDGTAIRFHSFRHTFVTALDRVTLDGHPVPEGIAFHLSGHQHSNVRNKTYNHGYDLAIQKKILDSISFGVDLSSRTFNRFLSRRKFTTS